MKSNQTGLESLRFASGKTLARFILVLALVPFAARAQETEEAVLEAPEGSFEINGYYMASFEYFSYDETGRQDIQFGWEQGSEWARECARKSQIALKAALENLTKDGVDQLGLKQYGHSTIYLITSDLELLPNRPIPGRGLRQNGIDTRYTWAYGHDETTQENGLIKFQGFAKRNQCEIPTEAELLAYAQRKVAQIERLRAEAAARPVVEEDENVDFNEHPVGSPYHTN